MPQLWSHIDLWAGPIGTEVQPGPADSGWLVDVSISFKNFFHTHPLTVNLDSFMNLGTKK